MFIIPDNDINLYNNDDENVDYDEKDWNRIISIGDIHGCWFKLENLLNQVQPTNKDLLIFHGDYLDRGDENIKCMKFLVDSIKYKNMIFLLGNHELLLLQHILYNINHFEEMKMSQIYDMPIDKFEQLFYTRINSSRDYFFHYLPNGGRKTLQEIESREELKLFQTYLTKIAHLYSTFEMEINRQYVIFVHAGIDLSKTLDEQLLEDFTWVRSEFYEKYNGKIKFVIGHTPTIHVNGSFEPIFRDNNIIMIDTGSYRNHISAVDIKTNKFWQDKLNPIIKKLY